MRSVANPLENLTNEQKDLLGKIVAMRRSGVMSEFIFVRNHHSAALIYPNGISVPVSAVEADFYQLEQDRLIILSPNPDRQVRGIPSQLGIKAIEEAGIVSGISNPDKLDEQAVTNDIVDNDNRRPPSVQTVQTPIPAEVKTQGTAASTPVPSVPGPPRKGRGFPANAEDHYKVAKVVSEIGDNWSKRLADVCRQLQAISADFPESLKQQEFVDSWEELAECINHKANSSMRERVAKYIRYKIDWVHRNPRA